MKKTILSIGLCTAVIAAGAQTKKPATATKPAAAKSAAAKPATTVFKNNIDSASYAIGVSLYRNFERDGLGNINIALLHKALADMQQKKKPALDDAAIGACLGVLQQKLGEAKNAESEKANAANAAKAAVNRKEAEAFLATNGKRAGVTTLPSGIQYEVLQKGTSDLKPTLDSTVKCNYKGTLLSGEKFDASEDHGGAATFPLKRVIVGWQQAITQMTVGSKWRIWIPADLGYGDNPPPGIIQPGSLLVFEVELLDIKE
ncbi:FKBP-type peptidyl-prolyl cis-trans isomerase [Sediminibacterium soli]|uniref:FKBP-type peptidyl-prolyl cis-trans isomerase n=1 Tax=Sediminibacterium soli TaxID=2698829 RepID=UPI00137A86C7|nr:FKBP-type peptidyl-prolyl cis-trans isomerase [Sediminibacterium soli]NCI47647.1 FKBP-type peptidyl-prolyl cis-trans isomerase [Sediminibacterium soli]